MIARGQSGRVTLAAMIALALVPVSAASAQPSELEGLLDRAAVYVHHMVEELTNVVCEEQYVQERRGFPSRRAQLTSDLLLVTHPVQTDQWMVFRDTTAVDGVAVSDQQERIMTLFVTPTLDAWERAQAISAANRRHHLFDGPDLLTNPLLGLALLQPRYRAQLRLRPERPDPDAGPDVVVLNFEEPVLLARERARKLREPVISASGAQGRAWIESGTGRVIRTEVRIGSGRSQLSSASTVVRDARLGIDRPLEMRTQWPDGRPALDPVTGVATYDRCRRFGVETTETTLGQEAKGEGQR